MIETLYFYVISLAIGLLIGIERERSHPEGMQPIGVRTFSLFALLGTFAAQFNSIPLLIIISLFVILAILLGYIRSTTKKIKRYDVGLTTEISALVVFCLGYMVPKAPVLSIIIGAVVLLILLERKRLHVLSRNKLHPREIEAVIALLIFVIAVIPLLPNRTIDPWQLFNPRFFAILMALIAFMQFAGYVIIRIFGHKLGLPLLGFLGGFISSTVVFATLPKFLNDHPKLLRTCVAAATFSITATLLELIVILLVASTKLLLSVVLPILAVVLTGFIIAIIFMARQKKSKIDILPPDSPLDIKSILKLSLFIAIIFILITLAKNYFGMEGLRLVTFFSGLFELQGVTLVLSSLFVTGKINLLNTSINLFLAIVASFISKLTLLIFLAKSHFVGLMFLIMSIMLTIGGMVIYLEMFYA